MAGGIVYQLNGGGGFEKDAIEIIVDYAYTGRCVLADDDTKIFAISVSTRLILQFMNRLLEILRLT